MITVAHDLLPRWSELEQLGRANTAAHATRKLFLQDLPAEDKHH